MDKDLTLLTTAELETLSREEMLAYQFTLTRRGEIYTSELFQRAFLRESPDRKDALLALSQVLSHMTTISVNSYLSGGRIKFEYEVNVGELVRRIVPLVLRLLERDVGIENDETNYISKSISHIRLETRKAFQDFERRNRQFNKTRHLQKATSKRNVLLKIEGNIVSFTELEKRNFVKALAQATGQPPEDFKIVDVKEGSILVTLEMPEDAALKLLSLYLQKDPLFASLNISKVELQESSAKKETPVTQGIALSSTHIANALSSLIPNKPALSQQIAELIAQSISNPNWRPDIDPDSIPEGLADVFQELAGKEVNVDDTVLSFDQSQLGDVTVRDVVRGNVTHININIYNP